MININVNKFCIAILIFYLLLFFGCIILTDGYPHNNDILYIFKTSSLAGNQKFINGLYGPGYTYYSLIFSNSLTILSSVICLLLITSSYFVSKLSQTFTIAMSIGEKNTIYLFSLFFHLIIISSIGFNHSEGIFFILFYNGILIFIFGYYFKRSFSFYLIGLLFLSFSILFRQHGVLGLFFIYLYFVIFETIYLKKNFYDNFKKYLYIGLILVFPFIISLIHLISIDALRMWQTSFRLHMIFFVDLWGDWRDLKYLIETKNIKEFSILQIEPIRIWIEFKNFALHALKTLYPFLVCFLISFAISKKKIVLIGLSFFLGFVLIILPGFHKGYFPVILLCFISVMICYKNFTRNKVMFVVTLIFLFGHLFYLSERFIEKIKYNYVLNNDIKKNVVPFIIENKLSYKNIFSDHLGFYSNKITGDINNLCNWGGWFIMHPHLKDFHPRRAILGEKNRFCDVKIILTRDKVFAENYLKEDNINLEFKSKLHYILRVN